MTSLRCVTFVWFIFPKKLFFSLFIFCYFFWWGNPVTWHRIFQPSFFQFWLADLLQLTDIFLAKLIYDDMHLLLNSKEFSYFVILITKMKMTGLPHLIFFYDGVTPPWWRGYPTRGVTPSNCHFLHFVLFCLNYWEVAVHHIKYFLENHFFFSITHTWLW